MRLKTPLVALSSVGLFALAACGSGGNSTNPGSNPPPAVGGPGTGTNVHAKGPVTIPGAQTGGTVTVLTLGGLTTTIDPSELYYTDVDGIMAGLVTRSLTQF